jgi:AraC family transcriptional regulator
MLRSVLSVVAGIAVLAAASFAIEAAVNPLVLRVFPQTLRSPEALSTNQWVRTLTFAYGLLCVAAGGYTAAPLARRLPIKHAVAMGILQAGLTIAAMLSPEASHASRLQWIITAVLSIPAAVIGGILCNKGGNPMRDLKGLQRALKYATLNLDKNVKLSELAVKIDRSLFHAHRTLRAILGETPKHFTLRLRVDHAAAALVSSQASILDIGLASGFDSHEAFCRAFRRRFRMSPSAYRKRGLIGPDARAHAGLVDEIGPCIGLYHFDLRERRSQESMEYTILRQELVAQPVIVVRRRVRRAEIAATFGAELPKVFLHAQQRGIALAGYPVTRYLETSIGLVTLERGMRVAARNREWSEADSQGDVLAETLPGGPAAVTIHSGPYDQLQAAYAALEEWIAANGFHPAGAPWEAYLNDPADHPNPQDWKTEVYWPFQP